MTQHAVAILYLAVAALGLVLVLPALRRKRRASAIFALLICVASLWPLSEGLQLGVSGLALKWLFSRLGMVSILFVPSLWLLFVLAYLGSDLPAARNPWLFLVVPALLLILGWTTRLHGLVFHDIALKRVPGWGPVLVMQPGIVFWFGLFYNLVAILLSVLVILQTMGRSSGIVRQQAVLFLAILPVPMLSEIAWRMGLFGDTHVYPTPIALAFSGLAVVLGLVRYGLLDVLPLAHRTLLTSLQDAVFVLDTQGRMVEINSAAADLLAVEPQYAMLEPLPGFLAEPLASHVSASATGQPPGMDRGRITVEYAGRVLDVYRMPLLDSRSVDVGMLVVARDETDRELASREREALIAQLQSALSDVKQLRGLIPICSYCKRIRNDEGYWEALEQYFGEHADAEFSHGLCPDCIQKHYPELQDQP